MNNLLDLLKTKQKVDTLIENHINNLTINEFNTLNENLSKVGMAGLKLAGTYAKAANRVASKKVLKTGTKATRFVINAIDDAIDKRHALLKGKDAADIAKFKGDIKSEVIDSIKTGKQGIKDLPKNMKARPYTTAGVGATLGVYAKLKSDQLKKKKEEEIQKNKSIFDKAKDKAKKYYT